MAHRDVRVVVVTNDHTFYRTAERKLSLDFKVESVSVVSGLLSAQSMMSASLCNVMIVDIDTCSASEAYLKQLSERNKLLIILTALDKGKMSAYRAASNREFVQKPRSLADVYMGAFITSVASLLRDFSASMPTLSYHDLSKTVGINQKIIVMASSTGGTEAVERVLKGLPRDVPPMLLVQHMPSGFTKFFADRINNLCPMDIREAKDNDYVQKGVALIAPAEKHMKLVQRGAKLMVECFVGTKMHGVMPAADVLFESVAPIMRRNVIGVILTGMGADGARGMMLMHNFGAKTIGQDKESSVVYGMPKVAFDLGAVDVQVPLDKVAETIMKFL